ncbi:AAA family ATPase [Sinorhizobium medicae]|nr:AAA family ATPase [Sinorhizobium medicae]MDX0930518.1 AAA family ATPase [Sinorhizobium medicae]
MTSDGWIDKAPPHARRNGAYRQPEEPAKPEPLKEPGKKKRPSAKFAGLISSAEFLSHMTPPEYVIDGLLMAGRTYTLTGRTGHGKTLIALLKAIGVGATGYFCGRPCRRGSVAFIAGENYENVQMQYYSLLKEMDLEPPPNIHFHEGRFSLSEQKEIAAKALSEIEDLALLEVDSMQAFFEGDDDNANMAMLDLAYSLRGLTLQHPNRPASLLLAHPVKHASRDNLLPRGGSSCVNELDGNLTSWCDEGTNLVDLHWQGKHRGAPFDPIKLELVLVKPEGLVDARGDQMPCTIIRALGQQAAAEKAATDSERLIRALALIRDKKGIAQTEMALALGVGRSTVQRDLANLKKRKWAREYSGRYMVTKEGQIALELAGK